MLLYDGDGFDVVLMEMIKQILPITVVELMYNDIQQGKSLS
jgi:hypothetical protein